MRMVAPIMKHNKRVFGVPYIMKNDKRVFDVVSQSSIPIAMNKKGVDLL